jgi:uncharacterized protein
MRRVLYIAAKAPRPGNAKTRLGAAIGHEQACLLYQAFLQDLGARFQSAPFPVRWYVDAEESWPAIAPLVGRQVDDGCALFQGAGDWTKRQCALFQGAAARGEERTILIASDSPQITVVAIAQAFSLLDAHELVFGPVLDGGYWLIGMRGWHDVLAGIVMSNGNVLAAILARAEACGWSVALLEPTFDVDEPADLYHLSAELLARPDLRATRVALEALGLAALPRVVPA